MLDPGRRPIRSQKPVELRIQMPARYAVETDGPARCSFAAAQVLRAPVYRSFILLD
jgi:hypothetical protein